MPCFSVSKRTLELTLYLDKMNSVQRSLLVVVLVANKDTIDNGFWLLWLRVKFVGTALDTSI